MNVATLKMPPKNAWNAYREYRKAIGKGGDQRDRAVMAGYKALSKEKTVIDLAQAIKIAGCFDYGNGLPKLAISRADMKTCWCIRKAWSGAVIYDVGTWGRANSTAKITLPDGTFNRLTLPNNSTDIRGQAIVPLIPPNIRPPDTMLRNYWILWEAEWKMQPPGDPILLKKLGLNLYCVIASWDLTPIEQAVLRR
jgi:hypothetical protein